MSNSSLNKNKEIAETAILIAIILAMTFVPYIGYISYGGLSITLIHIPVIIGACILGIKGGLIAGGVWGVSCMIKAITAPPTPLEGIIFRNPVISVIPRILSGLVCAAAFSLFSKQIKRKSVSSAAAAILGCVTNTVFVMGGIYLIYGEKYSEQLGLSTISLGGLTNYIIAAFGVNALVEICVAVIITIPVIKALKPKE